MQNINSHHFSGNLEAKNLSAEIFIKQLSEFRELPANEDILEVTYKYTTIKDENNNFKRSDDGDILAWNHILSALSGVSYDNAISAKFSPEEIIEKSEKEIINRQQKLDEMAKKLENTNLSDSEKRLLNSTIESYKNRLEITKNGLVFELEKSGIKTNISNAEKQEKIAKINALQTVEFGEDVSESWIASEQVFYKIRANFSKKMQILTEKEKMEIEEIYNEMRAKIEEKHGKKIPDLYDTSNILLVRNDLEQFENIMISREEYIQIFQMVIDMMDLPQRVEINPNLSSIFDWADVLGIPASSDYEYRSLARILELIAHEIRAHYVNQRNGEKFAHGIRSAGDIEKEEWLAMVMEWLIRGQSLDEISRDKRGISESRILAGEIFKENPQKFKQTIHLLKKLQTGTGDEDEALWRRATRNLPGHPQKKDLSYGRGLGRVIEYLKQNGKIQKLFSGKFGIDHITDGDADFSKSKDILFPFFVEDIIIFYLTERDRKDETRKLNHENFLLYLKEKYKHILNEEDFQSVKKLSHACVRRVGQILSFIKANIISEK